MLNYIFFCIGIIIIFISLFLLKKDFFQIDSYTDFKYDDMKNSDISHPISSDFVESIDSIEKIVEQLNDSFSETIEEIENKYYTLERSIEEINNKIHKDKKNISNLTLKDITDSADQTSQNNKEETKTILDTEFNNKYDKKIKVLELKSKGKTTSQIAKELNMGFDEVQLILSINNK